MGAGFSRTVGAPGEAWQHGTNIAGEKVTDWTGSPALGTAVKTIGDFAPAFMTRGNVFGEGSVPRRTGPRADYVRREDSPVPTSEQLAAAASEAYKASDAAGVVIRPESTRAVVSMIQDVAKSENLGKLPPKIKEASDILIERIDKNEPLSLRDADKVRQLINDAKKSTDAADQRLASIIQERYDAYLDNLKPSDTLAGDSAQGVALLRDARDLFRRRRNSERLDEMEERARVKGDAKYTQAGDEHALRGEFLALANSKEIRKFTPEEQAAIKRVAAPGKGANLLRNLGKFDPMRGGMATALGAGVGGGFGAAIAGPAGGLIGPVALGTAAHLANRGSKAITKGNVAKAREILVGRELRPSGLLDSDAPLLRRPEEVSGEVMPRPPLALPAPNIISGQRSAPGTAYAREQMGLTPDVERAGLLHPGMARENVPRPPLALPDLRQPPKAQPIVVDPQGRVAPHVSTLNEYIRDMGINRSRGPVRPSPRPSKEIQADIQRLARQLAKELGSPKAQQTISELRSLQLELEASQASR